MCFQQYTTYQCGHIGLTESECEHARVIDNPFFIKVACPNYTSERSIGAQACGKGGYYCRFTADGSFLDGVHTKFDSVQARLADAEALLEVKHNTWLRFVRSADAAGVSNEDRMMHPNYSGIVNGYDRLLHERNMLGQFRAKCSTYIQAAMSHYRKYAHRGLIVQGETFQAYAGRVRGDPLVTATPINVNGAGMSQLGPQNYPQNVPQCIPQERNIQAPSQASYGLFQHGGHNLRQQSAEAPGGQNGDLNDEFCTPLNPRKKRGRQANRVIDEAEDDSQNGRGSSTASPKKARQHKDRSHLRRSGRVQQKKVSYAESEGSSVHSREPSPTKSDVSAFSPPRSEISRSEASDSPVKGRHAQRHGKRGGNETEQHIAHVGKGSLADRIGDFQERQLGRTKGQNVGQAQQSMGFHTPVHLKGRPEDTVSPPSINGPSSIVAQRRPLIGQQFAPGGMVQAHTSSENIRPPTRYGPPGLHPHRPNVGPPPSMPNFLPANMSASDPFLAHQNFKSNRTASMNPAPSSQFTPPTFPSRQTRGHTAAAMLASPFQYQQNVHGSAPGSSDQNSKRTWLINTPAFALQSTMSTHPQITTNATHASGETMERSDSGIDPAQNATVVSFNKPFESAASTTYERMRRSFGSATDLTSASPELTSTNTDPKKRKQPVVSPVPSSKRMRLSLPGKESTPNVYKKDLSYSQAASMSSPTKMTSQSAGHEDTYEQPHLAMPGNDVAPTAAPMLVPNGQVYDTPKSRAFVNEQDDEQAGGIGDEQSGEDDEDPLDADWGDIIDEAFDD